MIINISITFSLLIILYSLIVFTASKGSSYLFALLSSISVFSFFISSVVIDFFGFPFLLAEITFASLFLGTDIIAENWGKQTARNVIWLAVLILILTAVFMQMLNYIIPHPIDNVLPQLNSALKTVPRILFAAVIIFILEQQFDIWFFHYLKTKTNNRKLWLRNILSTMTTQLFDVLIFYPLAFYGVFDNLIGLMVTGYFFKVFMALVDTPFVYLGSYFCGKKNYEENGVFTYQ